MRFSFLLLSLIPGLLLFSCFNNPTAPASAPTPAITATPTPVLPATVYFQQVVKSPAEHESILLSNNSGTTVDLSGWYLGDKNNPGAYQITCGISLPAGEALLFYSAQLGFPVNDNNEILCLYNSTGSLIDTWSN